MPAGECEALDGELKETKSSLAELQVGGPGAGSRVGFCSAISLVQANQRCCVRVRAACHHYRCSQAAPSCQPCCYQAERDELAGQLGTAEAELQNTQDCLEHAR